MKVKAWPSIYWLLPPALLSIFTFIVYYPSLHYGFVFDDFPTIIEYIHIKTLTVKGLFFGVDRWVSRLLNQYTYANWAADPFAYRIFDVLLHIVIGIMVFVLVATLFTQVKKHVFLRKYAYPLAILVAGLFLLHPAQTQTVSNITQMRLEGLVVFFVFAVLLSFVYAVRTSSSIAKCILYGTSFVLAAIGTGSKEIIVTLPFLVMLVDWFFIAEGDWTDFKTRLWAHGCLTIIVFGFLYKYGVAKPHNIFAAASNPIHNNRGNMITADPKEFITTGRFFFSQFKIILHYMMIFFFPVGLSFDYGYKLSPVFFSYDVIFPLIILVGIVGGAFYLFIKERAHVISFCCAWFFCAILPRASIFPGTELGCDYKTYVGSFGILLFLAIGFMYLLVLLKVNYVHVFCFLFMGLGFASWGRNRAWGSEESLWKDVLDKNPLIARAWNNYAVALNSKGDTVGAIKTFEKAIEVDNFYAEPHINIATLLNGKGKRKEQYAHYVRALEIGEAHPQLFNNLGMFYFEDRAFAQAETCFKQAIKLRGFFSLAWRNLGNLYLTLNKITQAEECYERALQGDFVDDAMVYMHGFACYAQGKFNKASVSFEKVVGKNYRDSAYYLGGCYFGMGKYAQACKYFQITHSLQPENRFCTYNLALSLLNLKRAAEAAPLFQECMRYPKENPYSALHYGRCLFEMGLKREATCALKAILSSNFEAFVKKDTVSYMKEVKLG